MVERGASHLILDIVDVEALSKTPRAKARTKAGAVVAATAPSPRPSPRLPASCPPRLTSTNSRMNSRATDVGPAASAQAPMRQELAPVQVLKLVPGLMPFREHVGESAEMSMRSRRDSRTH